MSTIRKELQEKIIEEKQTFKDKLKQFKKKPKTESVKTETERKFNALEYYKNLTENERQAFDKELARSKVRDSYVNYLKYVYPEFKITRFHAFLANLCQNVVERVEKGETIRLLVSVPPQHGKSTTITKTLPSWFVGRNPGKWAILTAYNADLAEEFSDNNRQLIKNFGKDIFNIETNSSQDNKYLFQVHKSNEKENPNVDSGIMGVGIQGGIVGHGGSLIIVDDPYKNDVQAENQNERENISRVFKSAVVTRARGKGNAIIVIHTRWHDDDLIGELLKTGDWKYVEIPCIWEKGIDRVLGRKIGQTLCPELGFDANWAKRTEKAVGSRLWAANYQCKPYLENGTLIKRSDIRFYTKETKPASFEEIVLSCDLTFGGTKKDNDPYCMSLWGRNGGNHYLLKIFGKRASFMETMRTIRIICDQYPQLRKKIIEGKANGNATIEMLNKDIGGFVPFDPKGQSKEARFSSITPYFEGGNVWFPDESLEPTIEEYVEQVLRFPNVGHDDFVDTISQYLLNYEYKYGGKVDTDKRFTLFAEAIRGF